LEHRHDRHQGAGAHRVEPHHRRLCHGALTPLTLIPALLVWQTPSPGLWGWLIFIGVIGTIGQFIITEAIKLADMTVLMPFDFLKLVWAAFLGMLFFAEVPDLLTWIGAAIVFASSFYIVWREAKLRRKQAG
jgi:drug/metabolite transporter (DMT)-like permease